MHVFYSIYFKEVKYLLYGSNRGSPWNLLCPLLLCFGNTKSTQLLYFINLQILSLVTLSPSRASFGE